MISEGIYTSSESEDEDVSSQQRVYVPINEEPPEMIVFGETAKKFREYAEQAGLLRRNPVTINVVNFPRGRVAHGLWKSDIERRQRSNGAKQLATTSQPEARSFQNHQDLRLYEKIDVQERFARQIAAEKAGSSSISPHPNRQNTVPDEAVQAAVRTLRSQIILTGNTALLGPLSYIQDTLAKSTPISQPSTNSMPTIAEQMPPLPQLPFSPTRAIVRKTRMPIKYASGRNHNMKLFPKRRFEPTFPNSTG
uniref:Uncharacterized protein n=1 Tax=Steinernema glaseri TaxID=37863 RepID=A0A1I8ATJ9_9BILA